MFDVLYSSDEKKVGMGLPSVGVKPCIELTYGFIVPCGCCIYIGGCGEAKK